MLIQPKNVINLMVYAINVLLLFSKENFLKLLMLTLFTSSRYEIKCIILKCRHVR